MSHLRPPASPRVAAIAAGAFVASAAASVLTRAVAGPTLGVFVAGGVLCAAALPGLVLVARTRFQRFLLCSAVVDGFAVVWLALWLRGEFTLVQALLAYVVHATFGLAVAGLAVLAKKALRVDALASAAVTLLAFAWLSWPIWLAPALRSEWGADVVAWLTPIYPPLVFQSVAPQLGDFTHGPLSYALMNLGQDVPYALPTSVWWCAAVHVIFAAALGIKPSTKGTKQHERGGTTGDAGQHGRGAEGHGLEAGATRDGHPRTP
jgi:hypothetical protein